jgi:hypothetical protein
LIQELSGRTLRYFHYEILPPARPSVSSQSTGSTAARRLKLHMSF